MLPGLVFVLALLGWVGWSVWRGVVLMRTMAPAPARVARRLAAVYGLQVGGALAVLMFLGFEVSSLTVSGRSLAGGDTSELFIFGITSLVLGVGWGVFSGLYIYFPWRRWARKRLGLAADDRDTKASG